MPKDFGKKELVWTLTANGKTNTTYGVSQARSTLPTTSCSSSTSATSATTTKNFVRTSGRWFGSRGRYRVTVNVGEPLTVTAVATDDGVPPVLAAPVRLVGRHGAWGLRVSWLVYRGPAKHVMFDPAQFKSYPDYRLNGGSPWTPGWTPPPVPSDGKFPVKVIFRAPGTYVLRALAHDGGLDSAHDVTVIVRGAGA